MPIGAEGTHILVPREAAPGRLLDELVAPFNLLQLEQRLQNQPDEHGLALACPASPAFLMRRGSDSSIIQNDVKETARARVWVPMRGRFRIFPSTCWSRQGADLRKEKGEQPDLDFLVSRVGGKPRGPEPGAQQEKVIAHESIGKIRTVEPPITR